MGKGTFTTGGALHLSELTKLSNALPDGAKFTDALHLSELTKLSNFNIKVRIDNKALHLSELTKLSNTELERKRPVLLYTYLN